jgi:hypothetical protein
MSGMVDVLLHCSEAGQKDLRLVGPRMHEYTMSTCYFLGNRPQLQLELVSLKPPVRTRAPAHAAATRDTASTPARATKFVTSDGAVVTAAVLVGLEEEEEDDERSAEASMHAATRSSSHAQDTVSDDPQLLCAGAKRSLAQMQQQEDAHVPDASMRGEGWGAEGGEGGEAGDGEDEEDIGSRMLSLSYSPYHRAKIRRLNVRRAPAPLAGAAQRKQQHCSASAPAVCYAVEWAGIAGKFDASKAEQLGVPRGPLRGQLVKGQTVTLPNGTRVEPKQCVGPSLPGGVCLIVDCPTRQHAAALLRHRLFWELARGREAGGGGGGGLEGGGGAPAICVVHMSPLHVLCSPEYQKWCERFPPSCLPTSLPPPLGASAPAVHDLAARPPGHTSAPPPPAPTGQAGKKDKKEKRGKEGGDGADVVRESPVAHVACCVQDVERHRPLFVASERSALACFRVCWLLCVKGEGGEGKEAVIHPRT